MTNTFADDTALLSSSDTWQDSFAYAQNGFNTVTKWLRNHLLTFNVDQTKYTTYSIKSQNFAPYLSLFAHSCVDNYLGNCSCRTWEMPMEYKYLDVLIDSALSFQNHIDMPAARTQKLIHLFRTLRQIADQNVLRSVYFPWVYLF